MTQAAEYSATLLFAFAILHTFFAGSIQKLSHRYPSQSRASKTFHILGEVEAVFGIWATIFVIFYGASSGPSTAIGYVRSIDFTEPLFVFVIMAVSATRAIRGLAIQGIGFLSRTVRHLIPVFTVRECFYLICLGVAPLIGSLITEPAIMTVLALILLDRFFIDTTSMRFKYVTLATLFVNVSIGGTLTHFAAPPVVMVAKTWGWDTPYLFSHFGVRASVAVFLNAIIALTFLRRDFKAMSGNFIHPTDHGGKVPVWLLLSHIGFLIAVIWNAHYVWIFLAIFVGFIGFVKLTHTHQDPIAFKGSLLVGFFLAGLVVLGKPQDWWLSPLLQSLSETPLFIGTTLLTAITDNAALTYLGAQVQGLSEPMKIALLEGAVTGGGLTVIANAPNPAGYGILKGTFGEEGINPLKLFVAAAVPTLIAAAAFRLF